MKKLVISLILVCALIPSVGSASKCGMCGEAVGGAITAAIFLDLYKSECQNIQSRDYVNGLNNIFKEYGYSVQSFINMIRRDTGRNIYKENERYFKQSLSNSGGCGSYKMKQFYDKMYDSYLKRVQNIRSYCTSRCLESAK